jgi:hypothetical protein
MSNITEALEYIANGGDATDFRKSFPLSFEFSGRQIVVLAYR